MAAVHARAGHTKARNAAARGAACARQTSAAHREHSDRDDLGRVPSLYRAHPNLCLDLATQYYRFEQGAGQSGARQAKAGAGGHQVQVCR